MIQIRPPISALGSVPSFTSRRVRLAPSPVIRMLSGMETNLTKIESRPVHGKPWEYIFYVDCQIHAASEGDKAVQALKPHCAMVKELGRYQEAAS